MTVRKTTHTNRQKMINLMYILLMAMLAINENPTVFTGYGNCTPILNDDVQKPVANTITDTIPLIVNEHDDTLKRISESDDVRANHRLIRVRPTATVSSDIMNILYASYDNPLSVSVHGVLPDNTYLTATNAKVKKKSDGKYTIRPDSIGVDVRVSIFSQKQPGRRISEQMFKVRELPEPSPYMLMSDCSRFRGGAIERQKLLDMNGINVALDNGMLDIPFTVLSFETIVFDQLGNAMRIASDGSSFSERQKDFFRTITRNKRIHITKIITTSPDGTEKVLNTPLEIIVK